MNPSDKISQHFTWKDALWLPQWNRMANEQDGLTEEIKNNLKALFVKMDTVRDYLDAPIIVHITYRPGAYNKLVNGAANSAHKFGMACDFHVKDLSCDDARQQIEDDKKLIEWSMRMEKKPASNWIHLDTRDPGAGNRYFLP